jgi:putative ABC transport system permease protein
MLHDLRFAIRTLLRAPLFTAVAVLSLALGIGANSAIFSLLYQVLMRSLPVANPESIAVLHFEGARNGSSQSDSDASVFSYPMYRDLRDRNQVFDGLIARSGAGASVIFNGQAERVDGELVSGNFFPVLGVKPLFGRLLTPADDVTPGGHPVAVLSYGYWTRRFGGSSAILSQTLRINGLSMTVVGVAPRDFLSLIGGQSPDVYVPIAMRSLMNAGVDDLSKRDSYWMNLFGRLKPGVTRARAQASLGPIFRGILDGELAAKSGGSARFRQRFLASRLSLQPAARGVNQLERQWAKPLGMVMAMVGLVLLIACANVANLLVSRAAARRREVAVRLAIGAARWRLMRQFLIESVLLACAGGIASLAFAYWVSKGLLTLVSTDSLGGWLTPAIDLRLLAFTFVVALVTGVLFGMAPAFSATGPDVVPALKDSAASIARGHVHLRRVLVTAQVALSLVLLIAAGVFARSLANLLHYNLGFRPERLLVFSVNPALNGYSSASTASLIDRLRERLAALPGVVSVGATQMTPLSNTGMGANVTVEGYHAAEDENTDCQVTAISPGYFRTLGVPLIAGREFTRADDGKTKVVIVNQAFADHFLPGQNPIGRRMTPGAGTVKPDIEIVGVVGNTKHDSVREKQSPRFFYLPYKQVNGLRRVSMLVRTNGDTAALSNQIRALVREMDASLPVMKMQSMETQVEQTLSIDRLIAWLAAGFGGLAMLLAAVGLYGVIAYIASRRTVEIGIRMALGASRASIAWLVLREVALLLAAGVAIGIPGALAAGRFAESQLFQVHANNAPVIIGAAVVLSLAALAAGYVPARRAARLDPLRALRYE